MEGLEKTLEIVNSKIGAFEKSLGEKIDTKAFGEMKTELEGIKSEITKMGTIEGKAVGEYVKALQEQANTLEQSLTALKNEGGEKSESFEKQMRKVFESDGYKGLKSGRPMPEMEVKAITSSSFTETNGLIITPQRDPIIGYEPRKALILQRLLSGRPIGMSDSVDWIERTTDTNNAAARAEVGQINGGSQSVAAWTSYKRNVENVSDYFEVSQNKLDDTDFIMGEITTLLNENIPFKLESMLFDGTGSSNLLHGLLGVGSEQLAKTFSAPSGIESAVTVANRYSALKAAMLQVELGNTTKVKGTGFYPNAILVNPVDYFLLSEEKDLQGNYLFGVDGVMRVSGVPVYKSQFLTAGTYLVGDFTKGELYTRKGLSIKAFDQHSTNALYSIITFVGTARYAFKVKNCDTYAFVTGTFDNTIAAITKTTA